MRAESRSGTFRSIGTLLTGSAAAQVVGLATMPLIARIYAPEAFGVLALFLSLSSLVALTVALRYEYAIVLPESDEDALLLKRAAVGIAIAFSALTFVVSVIIVLVTARDNHVSWWVLLIGVSVFLAGESTILYFWFTRTRRYGVQSTSRLLQAIVTAVSQIILGLTVLPVAEGLIIGYIVGQLVGVVVLLAFEGARRNRVPWDRERTFRLLYEYRKMPLLNAPNALVDSLRLNGINLIIGAASVSALGQFSMAWKLSQSPMSLIAGAVSQVYYQRMARARPGELKVVVVAVTRNALAIGVIPFVALALLAPALVPWLLGEQWMDAGLIVQALTPWLFLNVATAPLSSMFIVTGRQGTMLVFGLFYMAVPLAILWILGGDLLIAVWWLSAAMSVMLLILIVLSFVVASRYDRSRVVTEE